MQKLDLIIKNVVQENSLLVGLNNIEPPKRKMNLRWEMADEFGKYVGLSTIVVLRLFRIYGMEKTLGIRSWLKDVPYDPRKGGKIALAHWKLKQK